ncbi:MAG: c-type cytochrome [Cyclobacteriaceae bacterium]|nr:c-type cytochrome [Cyclobacteriaceae bacterium]
MYQPFLTLLFLLAIIAQSCDSPSTNADRVKQTGKPLPPQLVSEEAKEEVYAEARLFVKANKFFDQIPTEAPHNDIVSNESMVKLGRMLYHDKRLSNDGTQSCNSCHNLQTAGVDNLPTSAGDLGKLGDRNSPTVFNAALHFKQFWDGRAEDVEEQAKGPILNPIEMNMASEEAVIERIAAIKEYVDLFESAFPEEKESLIYQNLANAIGAFERTLIFRSRFDEYLSSNVDALSVIEKKGMALFIEVGCQTCHNGPLLGGNSFREFGEQRGPYYEFTGSERMDIGRKEVTGKDGDRYKFKVSALRDVSETYPYFHDGSVENLEDAIAIMAKTQLNKDLESEDIKAIAAFLGSLKSIADDEKIKAPEIPI